MQKTHTPSIWQKVWVKRLLTLLTLASLLAFMFIRSSQWQYPLLAATAVFGALRLYAVAKTPSNDRQGKDSLSFWQSPVPWLLMFFLLFIWGVMTS